MVVFADLLDLKYVFVKPTVLNPESNILVWCTCTSTAVLYSLQLCIQLYGRTTSTTKFSTSVDIALNFFVRVLKTERA
jgi:hypothetical protein